MVWWCGVEAEIGERVGRRGRVERSEAEEEVAARRETRERARKATTRQGRDECEIKANALEGTQVLELGSFFPSLEYATLRPLPRSVENCIVLVRDFRMYNKSII
jgi:hypothetical protein